ncbi:MAG: Biotin/acetyl-CoA-carboxylase ligase [candidate division TM6 bacterium GW2011_GWF2_37_49]|nr:MAG: Biotin/acetyl-CoA-carboxylase ligase [candidate division TM6 bacterium GW2011_GWF2_37_49]
MIGSKLYRTKSCVDSIAWASQHLSDAPDGSVFLADRLESAHGRNGRIWLWQPGQLAVTIILKPKTFNLSSAEDLPIRLNQLNMAISLGIQTVLAEYGVGLRWPNDFVLNNKKVGGLLFKVVWENNFPAGIILGFGININNEFKPTDELFDIATSLKQEIGKDLDMRAIYKNLLHSMNEFYKKWQAGAFDEIYKSWRKAQLNLGKKLKINLTSSKTISGTMLQVMPNGDIILIDEAGKQQIIPFYTVQETLVV